MWLSLSPPLLNSLPFLFSLLFIPLCMLVNPHVCNRLEVLFLFLQDLLLLFNWGQKKLFFILLLILDEERVSISLVWEFSFEDLFTLLNLFLSFFFVLIVLHFHIFNRLSMLLLLFQSFYLKLELLLFSSLKLFLSNSLHLFLLLSFLSLHVLNKFLWVDWRMLTLNMSRSLFRKWISNLICQNMNALIGRHVVRNKNLGSFISLDLILWLCHIRGSHFVNSDKHILLLKTYFKLLQNFRKGSIALPYLNFSNFDIGWYFLLNLLNTFIY